MKFNIFYWKWYYAIGNVMYVKTVGQLEIIARMLYQINLKIYFKKNTIKENLGIIFIIIAILLIILF